MKTISSWRDLEPFGIVVLTGEACGLSYRLLFDLTEQGKQIAEKCIGCGLSLTDPWNRGDDDNPHVGSIMLPQEMLVPLGVFALLESGCAEVWLARNLLRGIESGDSPDLLTSIRDAYGPVRRFAYGGTAGDRNLHRMTGRIV